MTPNATDRLREGAAILAGCFTVVAWWTYEPPYRWFADLQRPLMWGSHDPTLAGLLTLLLFFLPGLFLLGASRAKRPTTSDQVQQIWESIEGLGRLRLEGMVALVGFSLLAAAGGQEWTAQRAGEPQAVTVNEIVAGHAPPHVQLPLGEAQLDRAVWTWYHDDQAWYVPLGSEQREALAVFVTLTLPEDTPLTRAQLGDGAGMLRMRGLPSRLGAAFPDDLAATTWVVDLQDSPAVRHTMAWLLAGFGIALVLLAAAIRVVRPLNEPTRSRTP